MFDAPHPAPPHAAAPGTDLRRYAALSIVAALVTIGMKTAGWRLTGSVGLLADALESLVNLGAACLAFWAVWYAARPPDDDHAFGHDKAEYFAAGIEGALVLLAAGSIVWAAIPRLIHPEPIADGFVGAAISGAASLVNLFVARVLRRAGERHRSPTLVADAHHLMTDVWSSVGVVVAVVLVAVTGWAILDPLVALVMAVVIVRTGYTLVRGAAGGLMDTALSPDEIADLETILRRHCAEGLDFHALRTRRSGTRRFASVHVLVPPDWTVQRGHDLCEALEAEMRAAVPGLSTITHLEPLGDPASDDDLPLDRF
ncbi:MAG: cation diffusion facilitator family transporter [Bacteroidetes bacterium]|nr:cation diffusion facilitator family transporter [Bacteroidota bacterium]